MLWLIQLALNFKIGAKTPVNNISVPVSSWGIKIKKASLNN